MAAASLSTPLLDIESNVVQYIIVYTLLDKEINVVHTVQFFSVQVLLLLIQCWM